MAEVKNAPGPQRIAAFLLSLDREDALEVLRHLDADLVAEVASAMTEIGDGFADPNAVNALYSSIAKQLHAPQKVVSQSDSQLQVLLKEAFGDARANEVLSEIRQRQLQERPFIDTERFPASLLGRALSNETPVSASIVLSHVDPSFSAAALGSMKPEFALEVVTKMASLVPPGIAALKSMARNLISTMETLSKQPPAPDPMQRLKTVAELLNFSSKELERSALEGIEAEDEAAAGEIREFMFTWTDLAGVDKRAMQKILGSIDTKTLALSLKASTADVEENVSKNLSSRVKAMVNEERELAGMVPMSDVLRARGEILKAVHALIEGGEFQPNRGGEELVA